MICEVNFPTIDLGFKKTLRRSLETIEEGGATVGLGHRGLGVSAPHNDFALI